MEFDYKGIVSRLQKRRKELGYTQEYVSEQTGITPFYISKMENGHVRFSLDMLITLTNCLKMDLGTALFGQRLIRDNTPASDFLFFYERASKKQRQILDNLVELIKTI